LAAGDGPLEARGGITYGGVSFGLGGERQGVPAYELLPPELVVDSSAAGGGSGSGGGRRVVAWRVYMPAGSAALVTIPRV
jgi:hypothetical protein